MPDQTIMPDQTPFAGVYPCYENQFKIGETGAETLNTIAECTTFSVAFSNGIEEWYAFEDDGWVSRLPTAKSVTITVTAKRKVGDTGNDFVADIAFKNGREAMADFEWDFPDGTSIKLPNSAINVTALGSGDSTAVAPLEFEVMSNKKPTVTQPTVTQQT